MSPNLPNRAASACTSAIALSFAALFCSSAGAAGSLPCESTAVGANGQRQFVCIVDSTAGPRVRFTARFSGGHDDTSASLEVAVDGTPTSCDADSKPSLMGEDGDVSLMCRLSFAATPPMPRTVKVVVRWNHAEYVDADLASEPLPLQ